jgi:hypothetical protein
MLRYIASGFKITRDIGKRIKVGAITGDLEMPKYEIYLVLVEGEKSLVGGELFCLFVCFGHR